MKGMRWLLLIAGILFVVLGVMMISTPAENLLSLAIFISIVMFLTGIAQIVTYFSATKELRSGWLLVSGIISLIFGIWTLFGSGMPSLIVALPFAFAAWILSAGIMRIIGSFSLRDYGISQWGWVLVLGILGVIFGFLLLSSPAITAISLGYALAFVFIFHGINDIVLFFSVKSVESN